MIGDVSSELAHQLWLIYTQLKDIEDGFAPTAEQLEKPRFELGRIINLLNQKSVATLLSISSE